MDVVELMNRVQTSDVVKAAMDRIDAAQAVAKERLDGVSETCREYEEYLHAKMVQYDVKPVGLHLSWSLAVNGKFRIMIGDKPFAESKAIDRANYADEIPALMEAIAAECERRIK